MKLLDVNLTDAQRRTRAAFVQQSELPGAPELVPGQRVVLRDATGEYFAASVVDCEAAGDDERYLLHVGVRLPEEHAMRRLGRVPQPRSAADDDMDGLLDLLGAARAALKGGLPSQRLDPN